MALAEGLEEGQEAYVLDQIGRQLHCRLACQHATRGILNERCRKDPEVTLRLHPPSVALP